MASSTSHEDRISLVRIEAARVQSVFAILERFARSRMQRLDLPEVRLLLLGHRRADGSRGHHLRQRGVGGTQSCAQLSGDGRRSVDHLSWRARYGGGSSRDRCAGWLRSRRAGHCGQMAARSTHLPRCERTDEYKLTLEDRGDVVEQLLVRRVPRAAFRHIGAPTLRWHWGKHVRRVWHRRRRIVGGGGQCAGCSRLVLGQ